MSPRSSLRFVWTDHALLRVGQRGLRTREVEAAIRDGHPVRERNNGHADWRVQRDELVVIYDHPAGDPNTVRIVSVWRVHRAR